MSTLIKLRRAAFVRRSDLVSPRQAERKATTRELKDREKGWEDAVVDPAGYVRLKPGRSFKR